MERKTESELDLAPINALLKHFEKSPQYYFDSLYFLKAFLMDPPQKFVEDGRLKKLESMARKAGPIISSCDLKKMDSRMVHNLLLRLLSPLSPMEDWIKSARRIYRKKPRPSRIYYPRTGQLGSLDHLVENLKYLVKDKAGSLGPLKRFILRLKRELQYLSCRLMEIPEPRKEEADVKDLMGSITNLAYEAEYAIDSFLVRDIPIWCSMFWLQDIVQEFDYKKKLVEMESRDTDSILNAVFSSESVELDIIPIVNYIDIAEKLREVFNHPVITDLFDIRMWCLVSSSYKERKKEVLLQLLRNALYSPLVEHGNIEYTSDMNEYELERALFKLLDDTFYFVILEDVQDIDALNYIKRLLPADGIHMGRILLTTPSRELALQCRSGFQDVLFSKMSGDHTSVSQTNKPIIDNDVVGFMAETEKMLERLIGEPKQLRIISIVGMGGQGKTTLAKKLYSNPSVVDYFHIRAWCSVSQVYERRELLLELLGQVVQLSNLIDHINDEELAAMLCNSFRGRRFLVVFDDMWSTGAWNDLKRCFPNDNNGSRIIFTTRLRELASEAESSSMLQPLGLLSDDESWALLEKKLFHGQCCPSELLVVGREIAKKCKGLPLSVVLIAGLLEKMEKKKDWWKKIAKSLNSHILGDAEAHGKAVIELSYKHLPDRLKPCFLYFGAFLEDKEIPVSKLMRLWVSEGFIKHTELKSLEDVAEDYLTDLIHRSLVTVAKEKSNGGVKSCRVHDLLRDFCLAKAEEENFLQLINSYDELFPSSNNNLDYGLDPNYSYSSTPIIYHLSRLCIYSKRNHFILLKPSGPLVRSLAFFPSNDMFPSDTYDISFISHNFKFLRILDLEDINIGNAFKAIDMLVLLRYLAVQGYVDSIPSSIANLWNLETFCVKALEGKVVKVPDSMWDMAKLRHVHINDNASFDVVPHRFENSSILDNLKTFSTLSLSYGDDMEKLLRRLRGIGKLKCTFLDSWDEATNCNQFPELSYPMNPKMCISVFQFLDQLVSLKVLYNGEGIRPCKFSFPSNLKKLTLSKFRIPWSEISQLVILSNLEVLKLLSNAFDGETWEMEDEKFPKLKFLKLETLNVVKWSASPDNFPCLERLLLHNCKQLEEIPPGIGDILTLQMIEVMWCSSSTAISARKIQEEQLDFGNEGLKIQVHPEVWDLESSP